MPSAGRPSAPPGESKRPWAPPRASGCKFGAAALIALTFAAFLPALGAGFVWDDDSSVTGNPLLRSLSGLRMIWTRFGMIPEEEHFWPLTYTSFWFEYQLWGGRPAGYHLVNLLLHAANALLAWGILRRLAVPGAWLAAAFFAIHPVHVESAVWITERKDVLSGLFYLLSASAYFRWRETNQRGQYIAAVGIFALGLFAKSSIITLPAALLLMEWRRNFAAGISATPREIGPSGGLRGEPPQPASPQPASPYSASMPPARAVISLVPFAIAGALALWVDFQAMSLNSRYVPEMNLGERILSAGRGIWFYLGKLIWPHPLVAIYPKWTIEWGNPVSWIPLGAAALLGLILWIFRKGWGRGPFAAGAFFAVTLSPMLGIVPFSYMGHSYAADRFQYLACLGPLALMAAGLAWAGGQLEKRTAISGARAFIFTPVLIVLAALTWKQAGHYRDQETLFRHTYQWNPNSWVAHLNLGVVELERGQHEKAAKHFEEAVRINPLSVKGWDDWGVALGELGKLVESEKCHREAIKLLPSWGDLHLNLGAALIRQGKREEGRKSYREALRLRPDLWPASLNLAVDLLEENDYAEAEKVVRAALELNPNEKNVRDFWEQLQAHKPPPRNPSAQNLEPFIPERQKITP